MFALQRGASNLYFPEVTSSILIPPFSTRLHRILADPQVRRLLDPPATPSDDVFKAVAQMKGVDHLQLKQVWNRKKQNPARPSSTSDETEFRHSEFAALREERSDPDDYLVSRPQELDRYALPIPELFDQISLVERLAETRALTGFQRITPGAMPPASLSRTRANWLPAFRVHGEGIFLAMNVRLLDQFGDTTNRRTDDLVGRILSSRRSILMVSSEMILLHTLAHLLIKRLSFEAGYGASSIRERIYTAPKGDDRRMAGILLYTAAGDSEGTLGGLVASGHAGTLERLVLGALDDSRWCGADPVCGESSGQGPESLNLAACHACCLLPETSCELQNRFLDRSIVNEFFGTQVTSLH